jgi:hypothetical protein
VRRGAIFCVSLLALAGCPPTTPAPPSAASPSPGPSGAWVAQAERCVARLDEVVAKAEAGDREGALAAHEKAYFEEYDRNLEVASKTYLPEEPFEGKMRNVVIAREDAFAAIKGAVKSGAPAARVRTLVQALTEKLRADARKLDAQNAPPP